MKSCELDLIQAEPIKLDKSDKFSYYHLHFKSKSFLHNQVRRLVGSIISYACFDRATMDDIKWLLDNPATSNWNSNIMMAEPFGLYLSKINYDKSSFEGSIETHEDLSEEKVDEFRNYSNELMSDDNTNSDEDEFKSSKFAN